MFERLFSKQHQRKRALAKAPTGVMRDYLTAPFPSSKTPCTELEIVSLDLETTGLKPKQDSILSIGLVNIRALQIHLDTAWHRVIRVEQQIPESSAVIHQITDDHAAAGTPLEEALPQLLRQLSGKVMLAHYKNIEQNFLDAACQRLYGTPFIIPIIDTLELAQRLFAQRNHSIQPGDLRLFNLRPRYNLPHYKAHNALSDALATAELFLAMAAEMAPRPTQCRLDQFQTD
ncbi:exonuclease domain-containing protein [endosymbiont of Ridgeia piscesae]|jgi:DNA polymerase-3 subunit epsilon|uniref:DNA polymerase-3 subunit epsilon n=1 Tax=endosymbiont of Ridgeia piscesae TaxID=54398 RepID=A0A0T5Z802_9GAMM|nr:exonuclease domain-containing protein [endosymbiont of Ridgeia piscesae]KRT55260.1 Exonuclease [endosymbiont of Ridgeia piscesae]KRT59026.1 DNA polymerase-3 subunit epsilon [endosymbiont of Ridgeia piscesae]